MNLAKFPRKRYTHGQTPIERLDNFSKALGGPTIYIKRDDLLGGTSGGNKTRKLEFLMADACLNGADSIITVGAPQSNHCRLTLSAAVKENMDCHFIIEERVPNSYKEDANGNNFLFHLLDVKSIKVVEKNSDLMMAMESLAEDLRKKGKKPYIIPGGGSNSIGALGYVACAEETMAQLFDEAIKIDKIVTASGSSGTHAGLLTGFKGVNANIPIVGISVNRPMDTQTEAVYNLTNETMKKLNINTTIDKSEVIVFDDYVGEGYSIPTDDMIEAVQMLARTEGILLDPVYTGKTMAGLIALCRKGYFKKNENILFIHTGGSPALYAYQKIILEKDLYIKK